MSQYTTVFSPGTLPCDPAATAAAAAVRTAEAAAAVTADFPEGLNPAVSSSSCPVYIVIVFLMSPVSEAAASTAAAQARLPAAAAMIAAAAGRKFSSTVFCFREMPQSANNLRFAAAAGIRSMFPAVLSISGVRMISRVQISDAANERTAVT